MIKLPIELFEIKNELPQTIANELFNQTTNNYNLWHLSDLTYTMLEAIFLCTSMPEAIFLCTSIIFFLSPKFKGTVSAEFEERISLSLHRKANKNVHLKTALPDHARHASRT